MAKTDRDQVQELFSVYANALDAKDYDGVSDCFTADAEADYAGFSGLLSGRDAIMAHMRRALDPLDATQHLFANFIIDVDGDAGQASCGIIAQHLKQGETFLSGGQYRVRVRRDQGRWRMCHVRARSSWSSGERALLPKAG
jgi:hypothetical protein